MIIITARSKDTNTYKCYSVDNAINGFENALRDGNGIYYDFVVEFNFRNILNANEKQTKAITFKSYDNDTTRETRNIQK